MALTNNRRRVRSYGQIGELTAVDRLGVWLSSRQIRRSVPSFRGRTVADVGCGYHATFARGLLAEVGRLILLDVALEPGLAHLPKVTAVVGTLPEALRSIADGSVDVVVCNSVLEHLTEPLITLSELWRIAAPSGLVLVNVPSWRGKWFLETSAYRLGLSPADEMDDHKTYYDPRDLWPLLVAAGFRPRHIRCFRHKLGLNTFARCEKPA